MPDSPSPQSRGGHSRADNLSAETRSEIARRAAATRWAAADTLPDGTPLRSICGSIDHPLRLGTVPVECYVLNSEQRVLVVDALARVLGLGKAAKGKRAADRLLEIAESNALRPHVSIELHEQIRKPIRFEVYEPSRIALGYEAGVLLGLARAVMAASNAGALHHAQGKMTHMTAWLIQKMNEEELRDMIDEQTRFPAFEDKHVLAKRLRNKVPRPLRPWLETFPTVFFEGIAHHMETSLATAAHEPDDFAACIEEFAWKRLPPSIRESVSRLKPQSPGGSARRGATPRWYTERECQPDLRRHLAVISALMLAADSYEEFKRFLERATTEYPEP